jgi:hypothetical protein
MKKLLILLLLIPFTLISQENKIEVIENKLRLHERLFIEKINEERVKRNLSPVVFNQGIYDTVSTPQAIYMAEVLNVVHTPNEVNSHCGECVTGVFYEDDLDISDEVILNFRNSKDGHWNLLMYRHNEVMTVRMEYAIWDGTETVYVCVNFK